MMKRPIPYTQDLVLVGGGHTHALVLKRWGMKPVPGVRLTVINPGPTAPYTGMLPGYVAGHYAREDVVIDLVRLARFAGARLILGAATAIDPVGKVVRVAGHGEIAYDIASLDIGITSEMPQIPGFAAHALPAKPMDAFAAGWDAVVARNAPNERVVVIGGGVAGVELAMAAAHRLPSANVTVVERGSLLSTLPDHAAQELRATMDERGIEAVEGQAVAEITGEAVILRDGTSIPATTVIGAGGARPHDWLLESGLDLKDGYVSVDKYLRSVSHPTVYAAGDCADLSFAPRPKAGVYAVRAAPVLAANLRAALTRGVRTAFKPQSDYLKLISLGRQEALAEKAGLKIQAPWVWRWKDQIDRAFMRRLKDLPAMPREPAPSNAAYGVAAALNGPLPCGGCGAKVGPDALEIALGEVGQTRRGDVLQGIGDDAAVLKLGQAQQVITTDHLRAFSLDPAMVARVAALHAAGDVLAMGAEPQAALAQIILPPSTPELQARSLLEVMRAASDSFAALGVEIVGGHSSEGAEWSIGFTVTGILNRAAIGLAGAKPGDLLVLTRPLGSGVLLAAEMAWRAKGDDIARLWQTLATPQTEAAQSLAQSAHAMTDVTGFGLAGHLGSICKASRVSAELDLDAIPVFSGAKKLAQRGIASSLAPANRAAMSDLIVDLDRAETALLFDPQTAGGFLAAIPSDAKDAVLAADASDIAVIGRVVEGPPQIRLR